MSRHSRGFTLLELMLVMLILAIVWSLGAVVVTDFNRPRESTAWMSLRTLAEGIHGRTYGEHGYTADMGALPQPGVGETLFGYLGIVPGGGRGIYVPNGITSGWHGPYGGADRHATNQDPWGNPFVVQADGRIRSAGRNGAFDGVDDLVYPDYSPLPPGEDPDTYRVLGQLAVVVENPETGGLVTSAALVQVTVTNYPAAVTASAGVLDHAFVAVNLAPGRHRVDAVGQGPLAGLRAFGETVVPTGGSSVLRLVLRPDITPP